MKQIRYLLISAAVMAFAACSSDVEEQGPRDFSGTKVVPEITIVDQGEAQFTKAYDGTGQLTSRVVTTWDSFCWTRIHVTCTATLRRLVCCAILLMVNTGVPMILIV